MAVVSGVGTIDVSRKDKENKNSFYLSTAISLTQAVCERRCQSVDVVENSRRYSLLASLDRSENQ